MSTNDCSKRRQCIPIIYTKGTYYEVGYDVGRTFAGIIKSFLKSCTALHEDFLPAYNTRDGRNTYEITLKAVQDKFPQYIEELKGTADGADVPFYELFLLHLDNIILSAVGKLAKNEAVGCSSILVNNANGVLLGHTEDALCDKLNHFYIVSAHIIDAKYNGKWAVKEERFTSLCYAGHLPGYTMGFNKHGLVFSINTLSAKNLKPGCIPRHFLTRGLLSTDSINRAITLIKDPNLEAADGCSINMTSIDQTSFENNSLNIEISPCMSQSSKGTIVDILQVESNNFSIHCNKYMRLKIEESNADMKQSSIERHQVFEKYNCPKTSCDIIKMLGDTSNKEYPVFHDSGRIRTLAVGIFDITNKTWSLYSDNPVTNEVRLHAQVVMMLQNKEEYYQDPLSFMIDIPMFLLLKSKVGFCVSWLFFGFYLLEMMWCSSMFLIYTQWSFWNKYIAIGMGSTIAFFSYLVLLFNGKQFLRGFQQHAQFLKIHQFHSETGFLRDIKIVKLTMFFNMILASIGASTVLPWFRGDSDIFAVIYYIKLYGAKYEEILLIIFYIQLFHFGFTVIAVIYLVGHLLLHLQFQIKLLNKRVINIGTLHTERSNEGQQHELQVTIREQLIKCVKHHSIILKFARTINDIAYLQVLYFAVGLIAIGISIIFFLLYNASENVFRALAPTIMFVIIMGQLCIYGQNIINESEELFRNVCLLPWNQYDKHNKDILLLFLVNSQRPITLTSLQIVTINYNFTRMVLRSIYSVMAFLFNIGAFD